MSEQQTHNSIYPFYQFCLEGPSQNFLKCTNCIILGVIILTLLSILILQLQRRYMVGTKKLSKKCIILYMIMTNFLKSSIISNKYVTQLEPYFRTTVFIFFYYYISLKLSKLVTNRKRAQTKYRSLAIFLCALVLMGLVFVFVELIKEDEVFYECYFKYSLVSKIVGGCITIILIVFSAKLQQKVDDKVKPLYQDLPLLQMKTFQNNETQREDLRMIIVMCSASQFLTIFQMIYFYIKEHINAELQFPNCTPCQMIPCLQMSLNNTIAFELFLRLSFFTIIIILPYIALLSFFWVSKTQLHNDYHRTISNEEDIWINFFKKMGYEKSKMDLSEITEQQEISSSSDLSK
ncbi:unnamed protein product (macronuclear) [Paramecium tetraurelia]|uniref:Transmembrane protein n=1 Tax=Paramecium tetraurelia TaxID=5888 RepID=A0E954_PARTE|nr:uncharacterized protein GSPATT00024552001 [Paramecium tetraurelia]CAK91821.1 unnamed protein product [Paramecium tetraurelia]|eukprot:XP_001459218.1 hypothetical protein (macronuclear) [Paramecium tetraurelia strain d4-2]